jgi:SAM-dependent methyltransferase
MITEGLRLARTGLYRILGPVDRLWLRASGRSHLPPLWLRRHTGRVARFESAAQEAGEFLDGLGLVEPGLRVLDAGCGPGAMVPEFARRLGPSGRYVGFDVHAPSIRWCRRRYEHDGRFAFVVAPVVSRYGSGEGQPAAIYRFPIEDAGAELVLAKSLFTHLLPEEASHYLCEIRRALKPGRTAVVTAFLFDPGHAAAVRVAFPAESNGGLVRWRRRRRPTAAVAYAKPRFEEMIAQAGLKLRWMSPGYYPGAERPAGQDTLLLGH